MSGDFLDANVLLYLISDDKRKAAIAGQVLQAGGTVSAQVLNEFCNVALKKHGLKPDQITSLLDEFALTLTPSCR